MAYKQFHLDSVGTVKIYKRKNSRSIRLSVTAAGEVRVSIPSWMPYASGWGFVQAQGKWIESHRVQAQPPLVDGQQIGKAHRLYFEISDTAVAPSARLSGTAITVLHPTSLPATHKAVQQKAAEACIRALRQQAATLLPKRLQTLAALHGITYKSVTIKRLKSRWGSCDQQKNIVLNLFLMQLPWDLIDYVLLHELTHTRVMRHGQPFWAEMERLDSRTRQLRRRVRNYRPVLDTQQNVTHMP